MRFEHVVLSGGSVKCFCTLGALKYHEGRAHLEDVRVVVGSSAGAMLGLFMVLGYGIDDITAIMLATHTSASDAPERGASHAAKLDALFELTETFGLDDGGLYVRLMEKAIATKFGEDVVPSPARLTFADLLRLTGKDLVVSVTNVSKRRSEFWSAASRPDVHVLTAVRASIAIPLLFTPVVVDGNYYVDGGVTNNFPLSYITDQGDLDRTLAIQIAGAPAKAADVEGGWHFLDYLRAIIATCTDHGYDHLECHTRLTISVEEHEDDWTWFGLCLEDMRVKVHPRVARRWVQQGLDVAKEAHAGAAQPVRGMSSIVSLPK